MKITLKQLKQIIKEEITHLNEGWNNGKWVSPDEEQTSQDALARKNIKCWGCDTVMKVGDLVSTGNSHLHGGDPGKCPKCGDVVSMQNRLD